MEDGALIDLHHLMILWTTNGPLRYLKHFGDSNVPKSLTNFTYKDPRSIFFFLVRPINHVLHLLNNPNQRWDSAISPTQSCGLLSPWIYLHPIDEALAPLPLGTTSISGLSLSNWPSLGWSRMGWHHWGKSLKPWMFKPSLLHHSSPTFPGPLSGTAQCWWQSS